MRFFEQLLPETGLVCVARALPTSGFAHYFFNDLYAAISFMREEDSAGRTMYLAQSSFCEIAKINWEHNQRLPRTLTKKERKQQRRPERTKSNIHLVRSFWFDIDCGPGKYEKSPETTYPTQVDGAKALRDFCHQTGLPFPTLVNSGNGLYAHWFIDRDIDETVWTATAGLLKQIAETLGFKADRSRTSDSASVLRPPGTHNRKHGAVKEVKVLGEITTPVNFDSFCNQLQKIAKEKKIALTAFQAPTIMEPGLNAEFLNGIGAGGPPSSAHLIADKCAQFRYFRDMRGDVPEPLWYAALGVLKYTKEAPDILHEWSAGHPEYDPQVTEEKVEHWGDTPPATCVKIAETDPKRCYGCKFKDQIRSPIVLGTEIEEATAPAEAPDEVKELPSGFYRAVDGLYIDLGEGVPFKFYSHEFFPVSLAWDHSLGYETATFRHYLPHNGWKDFTIRSSTVQDSKAFLTSLHDNHVQIVGKKEKAYMVVYAESFMDQVRKAQKLSQLYSQMGWHKEDDGLKFVLGEKVFAAGGNVTAGLARNIPDAARSIATMGDRREWSNATRILGTPGLEPLAFALMAGAFGAPLLRFTGFAGALLSLVGPSGAGKTLIGYWVLSTYGDPSKLVILRDDTRNMMVSRLGMYGTLPMYVDEITNIDAMDLSDLVYKITQGRDKGRLTKNAQERGSINQWNTIAVSSSNASLVDKLGFAKVDASAEINRVFEYRVPPANILDKETATGIYRTIMRNYGGVGEEYVKWLVANAETHGEKIDILSAQIDKMLGIRTEERFWSAIAAVGIYGGLAAKSLGLIQFEVAPVLSWMVQTVKGMRGVREEYTIDAISLLGQFLDSHAGGIIVVNDTKGRVQTMIKEPKGPIVARIELDTLRLFISRDVIRRHLHKTYGSYEALRFDLEKTGALKRHDIRKNLGAGTFLSGVQQLCWEVDLRSPALGHEKMQLLRSVVDTSAKEVGI